MAKKIKPKAKKKTKKEPSWMAPSCWVPGQGLVKVTDYFIHCEKEKPKRAYQIGESVDRGWWCVFVYETRRCLSDGWPSESAAKSWLESRFVAAFG